ncbi:hypothetical protein FB45DRAFT_895082 [Roridomyces roridus]|uniref:BTB domain-containing protein n=1 Tax=Roridomyces roridus TaxID=1738132 RepID=A0AAD7FXI0_9AGAR|nr:hypothetical protein FB45DRAFT_895082 [Roridomyces roridus]
MSDSDRAAHPFVPTAPFDDCSSDVILRSSDNVDFHVRRSILSAASPFFKQMFTLPQADCELDIPIIEVSESGLVLNSALRFWYPGAEPAAQETVDILRQTLEVLILKYDMQFLVCAAQKCLRGHLDAEAIAVFVIACRLRWKDVAEEAARATLKLPIRDFISPRVNSQFSVMNIDMYQALLHYHAQCGAVASAATRSLTWYRLARDTPGAYCKGPESKCRGSGDKLYLFSDGEHRLRGWFVDHLAELAAVLGRTPGGKVDIPELLLKANQGSHVCPQCSKNGLARVIKFSAILEAHVQKELDSIELNLDL